ncbi:SDR family NAD(P)-dependent oxidoreductase [Haloprofundus sp. MHR1]|uniref:SDR family NAD(P)-dependent oxidoreductase n=1 Tax=Haloprofundus sp. MHR1 TaxID=2572921 RepID=UPI0010BE39CF|nr:SDR family oxidoreductase [Haloprofundus sp. MHR1]QCJ46175.1 SDR family oxidoreductase [Haloprofundus sp. MHR1]
MDDTTVVVTGASRGIGRSVAAAFAAEGARVVACARDDEALDELAAAVDESGGAILTQRADVRDEFDVERLMERAAREGRPIDVLVACAGVSHGTPGEMPTAEESYARFDDTMRTNVRGVFAAVKEAVPHMADDARVLVPSGSVAREAKAGMGSYAVSKAAAEALARGFAADLSQTVGVVDPGLVATDLTDGRGRDPDDAASMFVWAATEADASELDGEILDLRTWKEATR